MWSPRVMAPESSVSGFLPKLMPIHLHSQYIRFWRRSLHPWGQRVLTMPPHHVQGNQGHGDWFMGGHKTTESQWDPLAGTSRKERITRSAVLKPKEIQGLSCCYYLATMWSLRLKATRGKRERWWETKQLWHLFGSYFTCAWNLI